MSESIEVLITKEEIEKRVQDLADTLSAKYKALEDNRPIVAVGVLKGSVIFMAELVKRMSLPVELDFMICSSYGSSTVSSGELKIKKDLDGSVAGKHVILIEDIVDSGRTLYYLMDYLRAKSPESLTLCSLLNKPDRREFKVEADYALFDIPDKFVVGYGLDYDQKYRNLPYIGVISFDQ